MTLDDLHLLRAGISFGPPLLVCGKLGMHTSKQATAPATLFKFNLIFFLFTTLGGFLFPPSYEVIDGGGVLGWTVETGWFSCCHLQSE